MNEVCNFLQWKIVSWVKDTTYTAEAGFFPFCHIVSRQLLSEGWFAHVFFHRLKRRKQAHNWLPFCIILSDISRFPWHAEVNSPSDVWTCLLEWYMDNKWSDAIWVLKEQLTPKWKFGHRLFTLVSFIPLMLYSCERSICQLWRWVNYMIFILGWTILLMWSNFSQACWESWHLVVLRVAL